jgi:hypothetical protein
MSRSLSPMFIRSTAVAFALAGAVACAPSSKAPDVATSGMDLALMGSSDSKTNVHVLLKSNGNEGEKRDVAVDVNGNATESFQLEPGEHVMAIVCTDEAGNELLGTGTATFETKADTNLMILVDIDSLIDGEEVPEELVAEMTAELAAETEGESEEQSEGDDTEEDTNVNADANVDVTIGQGGVDAEADVDVNAGDTSANADADASANEDGANADASADASTSDGETSADVSASAGIAVAMSNGGGEMSDDDNACNDTCQSQCLEELLDLCGF